MASSASSSMQATKNFDNVNECSINFGSLSIGDPNPDDTGVPVSDYAQVPPVLAGPPPANFSQQFPGTETTIPSGSYANFPTTQQHLDAKAEGWSATSFNPSTKIWGYSNFNDNVENGTIQNTVFGVNYGPGNSSSTAFHSNTLICGNPNSSSNAYHSNSSFCGNPSLYHDYCSSWLQNSGSNPGYSISGILPNNGTIANQGFEILAADSAERMINYSIAAGFSFLEIALSPIGSVHLKRALEEGKYIRETLKQVIPSILLLISDHNGSRIFDTLLERCENYELCSIITNLDTDSGDSLKAALSCETGSRSMQSLIRRLKNTGLESELAHALSKIAHQIMTHKIASHVIRHCFSVWGEQEKASLHECVFQFFLPLATDPIGCISINDCIEHITGDGRSKLLNLVVQNASRLSRDASGNFVVQHVLIIQDESLNDIICLKLSGQFVELAQKKGGSHLVEKCLLYSESGRSLVLKEISRNEKTLSMLAKHQYGNYVVQTALKVAMVYDQNMYQRLLMLIKHNGVRPEHVSKTSYADQTQLPKISREV